MKFTEAKLEKVFTELLGSEGYLHHPGNTIKRPPDEVLIEEDLQNFLLSRYKEEGITVNEVKSIILNLKSLPASDLYESNKKFIRMVSDGFILKREDRNQKDIYIQLIDYKGLSKQKHAKPEHLISIAAEDEEEYVTSASSAQADNNIYKFVNQLEITGTEKRIPDGIVYINGLPVVVFEFKTAIQEDCTIHDAYVQLTTRYKRDIPELFKYNAFCVISDGVNNKAGSFFAPYEFYYAWRRNVKLSGNAKLQLRDEKEDHQMELKDSRGDVKQELYVPEGTKQELYVPEGTKQELRESQGISSMYTMIEGMFNKNTLRDVIRNFIYIPDSSKKNEKIVCRYPQYYAARALFESIKKARKPEGDGKGGTYFGATGCGKSFTMLFLTRLLMKSEYFESPTIILITDRTDLDIQLSEQFTNAKTFIGDNTVVSVESRAHLRELVQGRKSGGVFLSTIHKFTEDTELLTERTNVICISDEAHRSQVNLEQKIKVKKEGVKKTYGFAKYLHDSLPNATYVGFTGTPIDATLDVFGKVVDAYTMTESVKDGITVRIVYEGRAAKVALNNSELEKIEKYYQEVAEAGANEYQIEQSKEETAKMNAILGDPKRLQKIADDFVSHYNKRLSEGATVKGKAMFVCSSREIAFELYKCILGTLSSRSEDTQSRSSVSPDYASAFTTSFGAPEEWHARNLPHRDKEGLVQSITFRLADSLPQEIIQQIESELKTIADKDKKAEKRKKYEKWLDNGYGCCALANPVMAQVMLDALQHHDGDRYNLLAWSIMPNHVHVLIKANNSLTKIIQSWKSFTGKWALANNKKYNLGIPKDAETFWMSEYFDRFIRDEDHFNNAIKYILENPKKGNLPLLSTAWRFTDCVIGETKLLLCSNETKQELHFPTKQELRSSQVKIIMTRDQDDPKELWDLLGTSDNRKKFDREFKDENSNFKVAIVVDMWLTGFDVPFLDSIYIDKPIQQHNLIQTISRVNRKFKGKNKGLVVDYIGIKKQMNLALAKYNKGDKDNFEDIAESLIVVRNHLDLLAKLFHTFDSKKYFDGSALEQLNTLNQASEFAQQTKEFETRFMGLVKRLKAAYDICAGSEQLSQSERDYTHFYLAVRSIVFKLTKGNAPDTAQMNARVRDMIKDALQSDGVEEIFKLGDKNETEQDLFDEDYLAKIDKIKLPNTKIKLLQQLLAKVIGEIRKVNKVKGIDFTKKMQALVEKYNQRDESDVLRSEVYEEMAEALTNMIWEVHKEFSAGDALGIDFQEKAFYDILKELCVKYDFTYPENKLIELAKAVKELVDTQAEFPDWNKRDDIKSALKVGLILLLDEFNYPPVERDEVYDEIFDQAENFKKNSKV